MRDQSKSMQRREKLKSALVSAAERMIEAHGLAGLRARALALRVGCAVGAIYNVVTDLDDLVMVVNARTLQALERYLRETGAISDAPPAPDQVVARLTGMALAYLDFAARNTMRWRAVFDHRLANGRELPAWYREDQRRLFEYIEGPLKTLQPEAAPEARLLMARSLFSAVHGVVLLGLEEKLQRIPLPILREQLTLVVGALGRGLAAPR
jgi:AcrR family transcriptional regulator